jgi:hypothetical protein
MVDPGVRGHGDQAARPRPFRLQVESIDALKQTIADVVGGCSYLAPMAMGGAKESDVRKALLAKSATGTFQLTDPCGVWIDVTED